MFFASEKSQPSSTYTLTPHLFSMNDNLIRVEKLKIIGFLILILFQFTAFEALAQVKLPALISDGMILQRNAKTKSGAGRARGEGNGKI